MPTVLEKALILLPLTFCTVGAIPAATSATFYQPDAFDAKPVLIVSYVYFAIGFILSCIGTWVLYSFRKERIFRAGSRTFMTMLMAGIMMGWLSLFLHATFPVDAPGTCFIIRLTKDIGFAIFFGSLIIKIYRSIQFGRAKMNGSSSISDYTLLYINWGFIIIWVVIFAIWLFSPSSYTQIYTSFGEAYVSGGGYACHYGDYQSVIDIAYIVSITFGVVVAVNTHFVETPYSEAQWMAVTTYITAFAWVLSKLVDKYENKNGTYPLGYLIHSFYITTVHVSAIITIYLQKVWYVYWRRGVRGNSSGDILGTEIQTEATKRRQSHVLFYPSKPSQTQLTVPESVMSQSTKPVRSPSSVAV